MIARQVQIHRHKTRLEMLPFRTLVVEVGERCNNACLHCYNFWRTGEHVGSSAVLPRDRLVDLISKVRRETVLEQVALSGGEPLLRRDLEDIACDLDGLGLQVIVITNGTLLNTRRLQRFPAGTIFEITLFAADEALHDELAGRRAFAKVLENIVLLRQHGHRFVLACVITRRNADEVRRTIELGIALGAEGVLLNRLNLSRRVFVRAPELVPTAMQLRSSLREASELATTYGFPIGISVPVPPCVADPGDYPGLHFGWCPRGGPDSYYTLGATGHVRPCNHSSTILGDLRQRDFADIVGPPSPRSNWSAVPRECLDCAHPLKEQCLGGCPAAAEECYGDLDHRDPFVPLSLADPMGSSL